MGDWGRNFAIEQLNFTRSSQFSSQKSGLASRIPATFVAEYMVSLQAGPVVPGAIFIELGQSPEGGFIAVQSLSVVGFSERQGGRDAAALKETAVQQNRQGISLTLS